MRFLSEALAEPTQDSKSCLVAHDLSYIISPPTKKQLPLNIDLQELAPWLQKTL